MVDGIWRKRDGKLLPVFLRGLERMEWKDTGRELLKSR